MLTLPEPLASKYRIATDAEVRSWSFGLLNAVRGSAHWPESYGTLHDERIFGPTRDFVCACGKWAGREYEKMICDRCGVKVTSSDSRRTRMGHVALPFGVSHPLFPARPETLSVIPVLPAAVFCSEAGQDLASAYDELVSGAQRNDLQVLAQKCAPVIEIIFPVFVFADTWGLEETSILAKGLALVLLDATEENDMRCRVCGYPLAGLNTHVCPGCGRNLL